MSDHTALSLHEPPENWGGPWTEQKLTAFSKYVDAYLTILQANRYWETIYFDGFAGSGSRKDRKSTRYNQLKITSEEECVYKGAAERIIRLEKSFDYYYFVDDLKSLEKLKKKLTSLPVSENKKLIFRPDDCNLELKKLAQALLTKNYAALVFLDPFGMHIEWKSIEGLKGTRSDVWLLIPTGVIVNRLLDKAYELRHIKRLESFFGLPENEIKSEFYKEEMQMTLFGNVTEVKKISNSIHHIATIYIRQLKTIWNYVTEEPLILYNSRNVPIYHFVFATNNAAAKNIATDIIIKS